MDDLPLNIHQIPESKTSVLIGHIKNATNDVSTFSFMNNNELIGCVFYLTVIVRHRKNLFYQHGQYRAPISLLVLYGPVRYKGWFT